MRTLLLPAALALALIAGLAPGPARAGCVTGAAVGGVAGHVAGHHGVLGAAAGCAVGHHEAKKKAAEKQAAPAAARHRRGQSEPGRPQARSRHPEPRLSKFCVSRGSGIATGLGARQIRAESNMGGLVQQSARLGENDIWR